MTQSGAHPEMKCVPSGDNQWCIVSPKPLAIPTRAKHRRSSTTPEPFSAPASRQGSGVDGRPRATTEALPSPSSRKVFREGVEDEDEEEFGISPGSESTSTPVGLHSGSIIERRFSASDPNSGIPRMASFRYRRGKDAVAMDMQRQRENHRKFSPQHLRKFSSGRGKKHTTPLGRLMSPFITRSTRAESSAPSSSSSAERKSASMDDRQSRRPRVRATQAKFELDNTGVEFKDFVDGFDDNKVQVGVIAVVGVDTTAGNPTFRTTRYVQINWIGKRAGFASKIHALSLKLAVSAKLGGVRVEIDCNTREELTLEKIGKALLMAAGSHPPLWFRIGKQMLLTSKIELGIPSFLVEQKSYNEWRTRRWSTVIRKVTSVLKFSSGVRNTYRRRQRTRSSVPISRPHSVKPVETHSRVPSATHGTTGGSDDDIKKGSIRWRIQRLERSTSDTSRSAHSIISPSAKIARLGSVFLVRHGERLDHINPEWRVKATNPFDSPLSDNGIQQARETGIRLRSERVHEIIASPFLRTLQTAIQIAKEVGALVCVEPGIAEHVLHEHFNNWKRKNRGKIKGVNVDDFKVSTMTLNEICKEFPGYIDTKYKSFTKTTFPETEEQLFQRTDKFIQHISKRARRKCRNICIVSHQDPVEYMAHEIDSRAEDKFVSYCCLSKAILKGKRHRLVLQHDDSHLSCPEIPRTPR
eukprot:CAMPEP_0114524910 /NCGR_PEP_ID=MMETSP0109-20121206/22117_1 /TAXON_ID=29199 /ORGANISM="Chlorarachnion reptans, Strain CCCM449" /LENGTH=695 /DNA_ID=CAMNT_0001706405 /DNA_START=120 /DNA_END=2207 /DNA_ORIENTATION=+